MTCPDCDRLRLKIAALREDRNMWRCMCVDLFGLYRTLRDFVLGRR